MNGKDLGYQVSLLEFKLKALTNTTPEVYIVGSGKVARVITENNNIYIIGEEAANDIYLRGYNEGFMCGIKTFKESVESVFVKRVEDEILKPGPKWDFQRDYRGEFKKKGAENGADNH